MAGQAGNITQGTVLVILFVGFLFGERIWFGTKLHNFIGDRAQAERVGRIISSIIHRVNYYLLVKTVISAITGAMVFCGIQTLRARTCNRAGRDHFCVELYPKRGINHRHCLDRIGRPCAIGGPDHDGYHFSSAQASFSS